MHRHFELEGYLSYCLDSNEHKLAKESYVIKNKAATAEIPAAANSAKEVCGNSPDGAPVLAVAMCLHSVEGRRRYKSIIFSQNIKF